MTAVPRLRPATADDAVALARLIGQLGYATTREQALRRLDSVAASASTTVTVAELDGRVAGLCVAKLSRTLTRDEPVARLALLVTDEEFRGRGVGKALVRDFERWARERGAAAAMLTSASRRLEAHGFYRACGWEQTGIRMGRDL